MSENGYTAEKGVGGWEPVDTADWKLERINELYSPYTSDIVGIMQWDGERNDAPIKPLVAVKSKSGWWTLKRPNWFANRLDLVDNTVINAETMGGIVEKALEWQKENPVKTAPDPLNPKVSD